MAAPAHDQRHSNRRFVEAVLLETPVLAQQVTVVTQVDDQSIRTQPAIFKGLDQPADLEVHERQRRIVRGLDTAKVSAGQLSKHRWLIVAVAQRKRRTRERVGTVPSMPLTRKPE